MSNTFDTVIQSTLIIVTIITIMGLESVSASEDVIGDLNYDIWGAILEQHQQHSSMLKTFSEPKTVCRA